MKPSADGRLSFEEKVKKLRVSNACKFHATACNLMIVIRKKGGGVIRKKRKKRMSVRVKVDRNNVISIFKCPDVGEERERITCMRNVFESE